MTLQQLNRVLNQHGCPNAVVQMEYFVECADPRDKKPKLRTAESCMKTIQDFIKNVDTNGLAEWAYVNLTPAITLTLFFRLPEKTMTNTTLHQPSGP